MPLPREGSSAARELADDRDRPWLPSPSHRLACVSGDIFLQRGPDDLVKMREVPYDSEKVLQKLLAKFPDLLAGDQFGGEESRKWVLIERSSRDTAWAMSQSC
jgi:hypothetical protein